jgi:hypothetical protein
MKSFQKSNINSALASLMYSSGVIRIAAFHIINLTHLTNFRIVFGFYIGPIRTKIKFLLQPLCGTSNCLFTEMHEIVTKMKHADGKTRSPHYIFYELCANNAQKQMFRIRTAISRAYCNSGIWAVGSLDTTLYF